MQFDLMCPHCGAQRVEASAYDRVIMFTQQVALVSYLCPSCGSKVTFSGIIPPEVKEEVDAVLAEEGVTVPEHRVLSIPIPPGLLQAIQKNGGLMPGFGFGMGQGAAHGMAQGLSQGLAPKSSGSACGCGESCGCGGSHAAARNVQEGEKPAPLDPTESKNYLDFFKLELDSIETIEDLIGEIDATDSPQEG